MLNSPRRLAGRRTRAHDPHTLDLAIAHTVHGEAGSRYSTGQSGRSLFRHHDSRIAEHFENLGTRAGKSFDHASEPRAELRLVLRKRATRQTRRGEAHAD